MELQGNIFFLILSAFGLSVVSTSMALVLGCALSSVTVGTTQKKIAVHPEVLLDVR